jgi:alginate O-acetyltransferase complex protein AlgI
MIFSSPLFIFLFLPLTLIFYFSFNKSNVVLLLCSLLFYAWGEPVLILVMIFSILANYFFGILISLSSEIKYNLPKLLLLLAIAFNLGLLIQYKYLYFIFDILNIHYETTTRHLILLGVSFFSFQGISYQIDIYRKVYLPTYNIIEFSLFKTFFPQLIAGPIVRYSEIKNQFQNRIHSHKKFTRGLFQFFRGLAKKVLIADVCAVAVDKLFLIPNDAFAMNTAWAAAILFTIQIFFDFSGYSDMAIGLGKMFGFNLPINFNKPYMAKSMQDFWRLWHITLSRWFRDYLYISLGGNRCGQMRNIFNLLIVFLICGLWHGASYTFIIWGGVHGFFLGLEKTKFGHFIENQNNFVRHAYVLLIVFITWVIFRGTTFPQIAAIIASMFGLNGYSNVSYGIYGNIDVMTIVTGLTGLFIAFPIPGKNVLAKNFRNLQRLTIRNSSNFAYFLTSIFYSLMFILSLSYMSSQTHRSFIYFQF